jgi:Mn2+/Fe2+ NRAMP family transporter
MTLARAFRTPVELFLLALLLAATLAYAPLASAGHGPVHASIQDLGGFGPEPRPDGSALLLVSNYLQRLYVVFLGFVGVAALFAITMGGVLYMFAGANLTTTAQARRWISNGIAGIVIAGLSVLLLRTINPDLVTNFSIGALVGQSTQAPTIQQRP